MTDPVNHPKHYTTHPSGVQAIEITRWLRGPYSNAFKYVFRGWDGLKDDPVQELRKAIWYLDDAEKFSDDGREIPLLFRDRLAVLWDAEPDRIKAECLLLIVTASRSEKYNLAPTYTLSLAKNLIQNRIAYLQS